MKKLDVYLQEIKRQKISVDDLQHAAEILAATPQLPAELENPDLTREKREDLVRSLFPLAGPGNHRGAGTGSDNENDAGSD